MKHRPQPIIANHPQYKDNPGEFKKSSVTLLSNSVYYFIEFVYITHDRKSRRFYLAAFHHGRMIFYKSYKTQNGAKVGFIKHFGYKAWKKGVKPVWTPLYFQSLFPYAEESPAFFALSYGDKRGRVQVYDRMTDKIIRRIVMKVPSISCLLEFITAALR